MRPKGAAQVGEWLCQASQETRAPSTGLGGWTRRARQHGPLGTESQHQRGSAGRHTAVGGSPGPVPLIGFVWRKQRLARTVSTFMGTGWSDLTQPEGRKGHSGHGHTQTHLLKKCPDPSTARVWRERSEETRSVPPDPHLCCSPPLILMGPGHTPGSPQSERVPPCLAHSPIAAASQHLRRHTLAGRGPTSGPLHVLLPLPRPLSSRRHLLGKDFSAHSVFSPATSHAAHSTRPGRGETRAVLLWEWPVF